MYQVLVAIDGSEERALAQADAVVDLADGRDDVGAVLLHVFNDNPEGASVHQIGAVRRARERLEDAGVDVSLAEASGDPAEEILVSAGEVDADLVSVAGRKRSPAGKVLLGSVSQQVLLNADRPVLFTTTQEST
ncbi:universal stress protein [Halobacteriales archaeon QS_1_68_20]|nr:MAG: universal stress protein [Halobacteriales archaeon QS_1_68_20]